VGGPKHNGFFRKKEYEIMANRNDLSKLLELSEARALAINGGVAQETKEDSGGIAGGGCTRPNFPDLNGGGTDDVVPTFPPMFSKK
jgi:hypothetical protein